MKNLKTEIKWAVIFTLMTLCWMVVEKLSGLHSTHIDKHMVYTNFYAIPSILVYVFALMDKKKNQLNGKMNYAQGFVSGIWITLFVTILAPLNQYMISTFITPEFFPNAIDYAVESGRMDREAAESYFSMKNYLLQSLIGTPLMGFLTSAVVAFFTKSKEG
ncbi:hypothetical protein P872_06445 [Rhodonellum psychrophilum GCM71 = DSM 17998]|uniref:DUF4199 domain-containing protein n=2 Tax=Rhodonellum TaxID=336827 RepID=U5C140_9BACT|nr:MULTISPECIES: DUF4199 domain-containing protein [Rhodonellum]ERM82646.1 hypothetical protein P872_06445 [Rhodonellum psychrophilum GCM71 = DSM 17998]MDO9553572.1 DUF4199 domain-containing protein [Rhodonellum sp.]SDZ45264.1 Protein of unknown function [Rhodonellum ikkaensis]